MGEEEIEEEQDKNNEEEDSDMDREREKSNVGRKKAKKAKKTKKMKKPEMKDLMVGRRMASLNASAMMQASYGREVRTVVRDPLTMAIEASLRDLQRDESKMEQEEGGEE